MKRNGLCLLTVFLALALLLTGCSGVETGMAGDGLMTDEDAALGTATDGESPRKVIVNAYYAIETEELSQATKTLESLTANNGGYVQNATVESEDGAYSYARYELRIPAQQVGSMVEGLSQLGVITEQNKSAEDITDAYYDVDARRRAKEAQRDRILALIEQATTLEELLRLEEELVEVQGELDSLTGIQNRYDQQVTYATVTVELWQNTVAESLPFGARMWREIKRSFSAALDILQGLLVVLVWLLPYILVGLTVLVIVLLCTRKSRRRRKELQQKMAAAGGAVPPIPPMPPTSPRG